MSARLTQPSLALVMGILFALLAHIVEILIFAVGYYELIQAGGTVLLLVTLPRAFEIVHITPLSPIRPWASGILSQLARFASSPE